jgi:hypothetical protein
MSNSNVKQAAMQGKEQIVAMKGEKQITTTQDEN